MNSRAQPPRTAGVWGAGFRLLLGFVPSMIVATPALTPDPRWPIRSRPYLAVLGSSPLRIQEAMPPPDLSVRPPAGAPPQPAPASAESTTAPPPSADPTAPVATALASIPSNQENGPAASADGKPTKPSRSILPDDTRQKVHAEDFLPFFQPPGANPNTSDGPVAPPAPGVQPPSSATYRQQ